ncbi:MAG: STAS domain-containing protein [Phycisphaerales bacterium]|nr:STAS domain-containing protein [Phycisphaerales bacterium]
MKVDVEKHGSVTVLVPRDALSTTCVPDLERVLDEQSRGGARRMVLDMTHVAYVDSAGIELLLRVADDRRPAANRPRLAGLTATTREAFDLTDTLRRLYVFDTVEAAVRSYL